MSIFKHNLQLLRRYCPDADDAFRAQQEQPADIVIKPARNGQPTMQFAMDGRMLHVHSAYDPAREARTLAEGVRMRYDSVLVVFGAGLLYHVEALLARAYDKCQIVLIEPDTRVFASALREIDLTGIVTSGKFSLSIGQTGHELAGFLSNAITRVNYLQIELIQLSAYPEKYSDAYAELRNELVRLLGRRRSENLTICNQSLLWARNTIRNIRYLPESVRHWTFRGKFTGCPAVIVSSGPSLDQNVALLKRLEGRALVIAAYTSLTTLRQHGIVPDIAAAIDSRQLIHEEFSPALAGDPKRPLDIPLLYILRTDCRLLDKTTAEKIFATTMDDLYIRAAYDKAGHEDGALYSSGSVAVAATDFAAIAGCDPIIFVGQDLAYTDARLHSAAVGDDAIPGLVEYKLRDAFLVEDVAGGQVQTSAALDLYRRTLEEYIEYDSGLHGRCYIDATEGGARIAGTEIVSLAEAIARLRTGTNACEVLQAHLADTSNRVFDARFAAAYLREIENEIRDMAANPDIHALAALDAAVDGATTEDTVANRVAFDAEDLENGLRLADHVSAWLFDHAAYFDVECLYAESRFIQLYGKDYMDGKFSDDPRAAYLIRRSRVARILLEQLATFDETTANVADTIRALER